MRMRLGDGIVALLRGWSSWAGLLDASDCRYAKFFHEKDPMENKYDINIYIYTYL